MTHHEKPEDHDTHAASSGRHARHTTDGSYTLADGVTHTAGEEEGSYVDDFEHDHASSVKGSYIDAEGTDAEAEGRGEYTDRDE
ncbi:hypothetical protein [Rathayibacter toxicus]|uniref:DUF4025 domain-containing protein n=1 Tax=Rathayibacter toxicus TaxID=145458 RepID=A0A2S5Y8A7_9MICO|nr:hypothetical protein [Rathayibacter toxicus]PPH24695.1 hypothetical protein C5D17_01525 [Rathayibacter toxicus]PPH58621.1 hypothetical protein C5D30_01535 [Rathayibacter toxicus]PPH60612.1 hypothetical protein C5C93_01560 [Rathayibacter toxicus]PPH88432.1 hypothetical protein C5D31_01535 [Rathayibacter toxicus]PPI16126.1 hypothetical protein C5C51_01530 [Rathayibacter toxicus]